LNLEQALIWFGCLIVAVILHEISHGVVALLFGDDTAKKAGRLTLNPIPHIDPFGSIVLPAMGAISGIPVIAWAKPVPVNPAQLRNPRRDMIWVGLVGPFTNFVLMVVAALVARWQWANLSVPAGAVFADLPLEFRIVLSFALVNLFLGVFNLLPIPPLDGSSLIERVLPESWLPGWYRFRPYGILVLFALVFFTGIFGRLMAPFERALIDFVVGR
jgi:Zn-dependent protease